MAAAFALSGRPKAAASGSRASCGIGSSGKFFCRTTPPSLRPTAQRQPCLQRMTPAVWLAARSGAAPPHIDIRREELLQGWSYRNMWRVTHNEHGAFMARDAHGQALYIDHKA